MNGHVFVCEVAGQKSERSCICVWSGGMGQESERSCIYVCSDGTEK